MTDLRQGTVSMTLLLAFCLAACGGEADSFGPGMVARVDGDGVRYAEFERYLSQVGEDPDSLEGSVMAALFLRFVDQRVLVRMAVDEGLVTGSASPAVAESMLLQSIDLPPTSDDELLEAAASFPGGPSGSGSVTLRQLLVSERSQAQSVIDAVAAGQDFAEASAEVLGDPSAVVRSTLQLEDLPKALRTPIEQTAEGGLTGPVEMQYGVHVFEILQRHAAGSGPDAQQLEEARTAELERRRRAVLQERLEEAWRRYNVEIAHAKLPFVLAADSSPARRSASATP